MAIDVEAHEDPSAAIGPDLNLRAVIADSLERTPEAEIAAVDLAAVTSLRADGNGIADRPLGPARRHRHPPSFWRGWRLSLAPPPTEDDVVPD